VGICNEWREEVYEKAHPPIEVTEVGMVRVVRRLALASKPLPRNEIEVGRLRVVSPLEEKK
jgi:hypothetical protein